MDASVSTHIQDKVAHFIDGDDNGKKVFISQCEVPFDR
jgi:hypothetical protein